MLKFKICLARLFFVIAGIFVHSLAHAESVSKKWQPIPNVELYEYEISKEQDFQSKNLLKTGSGRESQFNISLDPGVYFYRVRAINKTGQSSPWSSPEKIYVEGPEVKIASPVKNEIIEVPEVNPEIIFEWKTVIGAQYYVLRLTNGSQVKTHKVFVPRVVVPLEGQGLIKYRVEAYNGINPISRSEEIPFTLKFSKTPPPRILEPRDSHVLPAYEPFPLRWVQLAPTRSSEVSITKLDENKKVISVEQVHNSEIHEVQALEPGNYQIAVRNYLDDSGNKYTQSAVTVEVVLNPNTLTTPKFGFEARLLGGLAFGWNAYQSHLAPNSWLTSGLGKANFEPHGRIKFHLRKDWGAEIGVHHRKSDLRINRKFNSNFGDYGTDVKDTMYYFGPTYKFKDFGPTMPVLLKGFLFYEQKNPLAITDSFSSQLKKFNEQFWGISAAAEMRWFGWHPKWDLITEHRLDFYFVSKGSVFGQESPNFILPALRSELYIRRKLGSDMRLLIGGQLYLQDLREKGTGYESRRNLATIGPKLGLELEL